MAIKYISIVLGTIFEIYCINMFTNIYFFWFRLSSKYCYRCHRPFTFHRKFSQKGDGD